MNLTPVKVRGKRKRSHVQKSSTNPPSGLVAARPEPRRSRRLLATVRAARLARRTSLESLPAEILEMIFLYSLNTSLPLASHLIGAKLSGKATLIRYLVNVFGDSWKSQFERPYPEMAFDENVVYEGMQGPRLEDNEWRSEGIEMGDPKLQTAALQAPWISVNILLQAQQVHHDTISPKPWYAHRDTSSLIDPLLEDEGALPAHPHDLLGGFGHFNAIECFEYEYQAALRWKPFIEYSDEWRVRTLHPSTRIPERLIIGPWDDARQRLLFYLVRGGIDVYWRSGTHLPWEMKMEGILKAVIGAPVPNVFVSNMIFPMKSSPFFYGLPPDENSSLQRMIKQRLSDEELSPASRKTLEGTLAGLEEGNHEPG